VQTRANITIERVSEAVRSAQRQESLTQQEIAAGTGVDQALISRVIAGKIKRLTPRVLKIYAYVNMRKRRRDHRIPDHVKAAVLAYLTAGGDAQLLCRQIALLRSARR
jgi:predicted transcriptional regulator